MLPVPFVSVIIPVHNDGDRLWFCLIALDQQTYPLGQFEVIVVDNNSTEDLKAICQRFDRVCYTFESKAGNNAARNRGITEAKGDLIAITDADCIPHSDWLSAGVRLLQAHLRAGIIGGQMRFSLKAIVPRPLSMPIVFVIASSQCM